MSDANGHAEEHHEPTDSGDAAPSPEDISRARTEAFVRAFLRVREASNIAQGFRVEGSNGEQLRFSVGHQDRQSYALEALAAQLETSNKIGIELLNALRVCAGALSAVADELRAAGEERRNELAERRARGLFGRLGG